MRSAQICIGAKDKISAAASRPPSSEPVVRQTTPTAQSATPTVAISDTSLPSRKITSPSGGWSRESTKGWTGGYGAETKRSGTIGW
jgi:hypothetical protein